MKKQSKKQIEANLRNKLAKDNNDKYNNLLKKFNQISEELKNTKEKFYLSTKQISELEEKVKQYEDWNYRLQEFCNMNEEDRKISIEKMRTEETLKRYIADSSLLKLFQNFI